MGDGGRCSPLIVGAELLCAWHAAPYDALERTLRSLIARGGCRLVVLCWRVRNFREEGFLGRLADLGEVRTVFRSDARLLHDPPPPDGADEEARNAWQCRHCGSVAVGVLRVAPGATATGPGASASGGA